MHQAESSSSLFSLWTGLSLPAAVHPFSRRRSCLQLRTDQCFCPMRTFTSLLVRTLRRTPRPRFRALAPAASFRGSLCFASLSAKKYVTTYFSVLERTSRYPSRSCSFVAELLAVSLRKALALRCQCVERCRTLKFTGRKRSGRGSPPSSLLFVVSAGGDLRGRAAPLHDDS